MRRPLTDTYSFALEHADKKLRLVIYDGDTELVCRKEERKRLDAFLLRDSDHIFKGRLQLLKKKDTIAIQVKGKVVGQLNTADFQHMLHEGNK